MAETKKAKVSPLIAYERMLLDHGPYGLIVLVNIITFNSYTLQLMLFIIWCLMVILVNQLEIFSILDMDDIQKVSKKVHHVIIVAFFLMNLFNNQRVI